MKLWDGPVMLTYGQHFQICTCVEYNKVKFCLWIFFFFSDKDDYFYHNLKRWITPKLCSSEIKDCCLYGFHLIGEWSPTVFWRQKCLFKNPLRFNTVGHYLLIIRHCFRTLTIQKCFSDLIIRLRGDWNEFYLWPLLFGTSSASFPLLLKLSPNSPFITKTFVGELASAFLHSVIAGQVPPLSQFKLQQHWPSLHFWNRSSSHF